MKIGIGFIGKGTKLHLFPYKNGERAFCSLGPQNPFMYSDAISEEEVGPEIDQIPVCKSCLREYKKVYYF